MAKDPGRPRVAVGCFQNPIEACMAQSKLAAEGIRSQLPERYNRYLAMTTGAIRLYVAPEDYERACAMLDVAGHEIDMDEYVDPDDTGYVRCPSCRSASVLASARPGWLWLLGLMLLGVPFMIAPRTWSCRKCGNSWHRAL